MLALQLLCIALSLHELMAQSEPNSTTVLKSEAGLSTTPQQKAEAESDNTATTELKREARLGEFPMLAQIREGDMHICAGSIVAVKMILTAAHCFDRCDDKCVEKRIVMVGDVMRHKSKATPSSRQETNIKQHIIHESYQAGQPLYEIALVELMQKLKLSVNVAVAQIIKQRPTSGTQCVLAGWVYSQCGEPVISNGLVMTQVQFRDDNVCRQALPKYDSDTMSCASEQSPAKGACIGDSGAPLICGKNQVAGLTAYRKCCVPPDNIAAYSDMGEFKCWVATHKVLIQEGRERNCARRKRVGSLIAVKFSLSYLMCISQIKVNFR